jgi:hypothetical protein
MDIIIPEKYAHTSISPMLLFSLIKINNAYVIHGMSLSKKTL